MYVTHRLMVMHQCDKYGKPMSNQKKLWTGHESAQTDGQTDRKTDKQTDRQTDRQNDFYITPELRSRGYYYLEKDIKI